MMFAPLLLAATVAAHTDTPSDQVSFEILVGGERPSGFRIDASDRIEVLEGNPHRAQALPQIAQGERGLYAKAVAQFARYRAMVGEPCEPQASDVLSFRFTWREKGALRTIAFADSCGGFPTDLTETVRPIGLLIDKATGSPRDPAVVPLD